ncbi:MAG: hypothetical protein ACOY9D_07385 [Pseudomonadota bacterium]
MTFSRLKRQQLSMLGCRIIQNSLFSAFRQDCEFDLKLAQFRFGAQPGLMLLLKSRIKIDPSTAHSLRLYAILFTLDIVAGQLV